MEATKENVPKRVLHVIGAMDRGGAETLIMNLYRTIDHSRIQFDFLVHEQHACDYDAEIESLGGKIFHIQRFTGLNAIAYRRACRRFFDAHHDYAAVHIHIGSCAAIVIKEAHRYGLFSIAHSHCANSSLSFSTMLFNAVSFPTRYLADYFLGCSEQAGLDRFGKRVVSGDRFSVLINGVDASAYVFDSAVRATTRSLLDIDASAPLFCHVGRFAHQKNHAFLLDIFKEILKALPDAQLLLMGRGPLEQGVKDKARQLGILENVRFLGVRDDVPHILIASDVFVFPSLFEGLPVSVVEAQAAGLPCVVSEVVPKTACVTDQAERLSIDEPAEVWATRSVHALRASTVASRRDANRAIIDSGFDIHAIAARLASLYETHVW